MPLHSDSTPRTAPANRRALPRAAWVLAAALLLGAVTTAESAVERVSASTQTNRTSARLVLEWARPVDYSVLETASHTFVRFSRPFTGTLEKARAPLARYLVELRLAGGGRVLVLRRSGEWRFTHQRRGGAVMFTWIGAAPAPARRPSADENPTDDAPMPVRATPAETRRLARPGESPRSPSAVRRDVVPRPAAPPRLHAEHLAMPASSGSALKTPVASRETPLSHPVAPPARGDDSVRRLPEGPSPQWKLADGARPAAPYSDTPRPPHRPVAPAARGENSAREPSPKSMRANAEGARPAAPSTDVLIPPARPVAPPPARTERPSGPVPEGPAPVVLRPKPAGSETDALPPRPTVPPARRIEPPSVPHADTSPPAPRSPRAEEAPLPQPLQKAPEPERAPQPPIRTASEARPAPDAPIEPPVMPAISPTLSVTSAGGETRIVLAWPEPVAAAVFRHGDRIWIVFPRREAFDVQKIGAQLGPGVDKLLRIEHAQATVLAAHVRPDVRARVAHQRNVWTIRLKRERGTPEAPEVKIALSRAIAEQAAVPLPGAEAPLRIVVPETSGKLHVVPSRASAAVAGNRTFVTFRIVAAAQGGVVEALADGLIVGAEGGAITIRRDAGLMLSNGSAQHGQ